MSARGTLALVAVLAVLVAWIALDLRPAPSATTAGAQPLLAARPSAVARLEVATPERALAALRHADGWTDADGRPWPPAPVGDVVDTLAGLRPVMVVDPDPSDVSEYGLAPAPTRLRLAAADGATLLDLELGERNPAGTGVYARRAGRREVLLVGAVLAWELEKLLAAAPSRTTLDR